jgi:hypothetical protein
MTVQFRVSFSVSPQQPRSTSPSYRGRPAIVFRSAFIVPAVAETAQVSPLTAVRMDCVPGTQFESSVGCGDFLYG